MRKRQRVIGVISGFCLLAVVAGHSELFGETVSSEPAPPQATLSSVLRDPNFWAQVPSEARPYAQSLQHMLEPLLTIKAFVKTYDLEHASQPEHALFEAAQDMVNRWSEKTVACKQVTEAFSSLTPPPGFINSHANVAQIAEQCQRVAENGDAITKFFKTHMTQDAASQNVHSESFDQLMKLIDESERKASFRDLDEMTNDWLEAFQQDIDAVTGKNPTNVQTATEYLLGASLTPQQTAKLHQHPEIIKYHRLLRDIMGRMAQLRDQAEGPELLVYNVLTNPQAEHALDIGAACRGIEEGRGKLVEHLDDSWQRLDAAKVPEPFTPSHQKYLKVLEMRADLERAELDKFRVGCAQLQTSASATAGEIIVVFRDLHNATEEQKIDAMGEEFFSVLRREIYSVLAGS